MQHNQRFIFTGGPGMGKTTTLEVIERAGYSCVPEVARKIIRKRLQCGLSPRPSPVEFAQEILAADLIQYGEVPDRGSPIFFDRGLPDSLGMLHECGEIELSEVRNRLMIRPYAKEVFHFPPWEDIYSNDTERDQTFAEAVEVSQRIEDWYGVLGFDLIKVPLLSPEARAEFVLSRLTG